MILDIFQFQLDHRQVYTKLQTVEGSDQRVPNAFQSLGNRYFEPQENISAEQRSSELRSTYNFKKRHRSNH
jgi:hypothetical protein